MVSYVVAGVIFEKFGLKKTYLTSYLFGVVCTALYITFGHLYEHLIPFLLLGSFFGFSSVLLINWIATPHLFPVIYASST